MSTFFRREALEHRQGQWLGSIQLVRPVSLTALTAAAVLAAAAVGAYLCIGEYTRKARVAGYLAPQGGLVRLEPMEAATVVERRVAEGQRVQKGEVLYVLSVDRATLGGDTEASVKRSLATRERSLRGTAAERRALLEEQRGAMARRIADMRHELVQMGEQVRVQSERLALAEATRRRLEALQRENFVSETHVQTKTEEVLGIRAELEDLKRRQAVQRREINALEAEQRELPILARVQQSEIDRELATVAQEAAESEARHRLVLAAPQDGVISAVLAEPGQRVGPGLALASLMPAGAQLQAELYAPSSAVGFLRAEQPVALRYQAFPYQKFGHQWGRIVQVSRTPLQQTELDRLPLAVVRAGTTALEPLYRITVALDRQELPATGAPQALAAGMQLEADVMLESRRLIEWLFEPLLGIAGRV